MVTNEIDFASLAARFDVEGISAVVLMGSFARGDAGIYSDVDLIRLADGEAGEFGDDGSHLIDGRLVVVSTVTPARIEAIFTDPEQATTFLAGLRSGHALIDRDGVFAAVQARAAAFEWGTEIQERANAYASEQMVGWIEEVHKALEGLRRRDTGRLLNARFGLSWGLSGIVRVYKGVLISGDNGMYDEVDRAMAGHDDWIHLRRSAFGIEDEAGVSPTLCQQVMAGLRLYVLTTEALSDALRPDDRPLIEETAALIRTRLEADGYDKI